MTWHGARRTGPAPLRNHGFPGRRQSFRSRSLGDVLQGWYVCNEYPTLLSPPPSMRISIQVCWSAWACESLSTYGSRTVSLSIYICMLKCMGLCVWWWYDDDSPTKKKQKVAVLPRRNMNHRPSSPAYHTSIVLQLLQLMQSMENWCARMILSPGHGPHPAAGRIQGVEVP